MKRQFPIIAAFALVLVPMGAADTTTDKGALPSRIAGSWVVSYEDLALGEVDGTAIVELDGHHVKVVLHHPGSGREFTLKSESVTEKGDDYTIVLVGEGPSSLILMPGQRIMQQASNAASGLPPAPAVNLPGPAPTAAGPGGPAQGSRVEIPDQSDKMEVRVADFTGMVELKPWHAVDANRVELQLHFGKTGGAAAFAGNPQVRLTGTWKFFADPVTWRDGLGGGRVGYFRRDLANPNIATQSGAEVWSVPVPRLRYYAVTAMGYQVIDELYLNVPTFIEAEFDPPFGADSYRLNLSAAGTPLTLDARKFDKKGYLFRTGPFVPTEPKGGAGEIWDPKSPPKRDGDSK